MIKMASCRGLFLWGSVGIVVIISCCIAGVCCDVPDDVVYTDLQKTVRLGGSVVLKCQFRGTPLAVYWKKGDDPRTAPNLVSWIPGDPVTGLCEGERPCQIMEMNEDFSLIIKEVSIAERGLYICRVSSYKGILIHNFTDISVFSPPLEPYPTIKDCNDSETLEGHDCVISSPDGINITCSASDFYPYLHLFFLRGSEKIPITKIKEWTNDDGTRSKSVSISAMPHDTPYVCIASDVPGDQKERALTVFVSPAQNDDTSTASTGSTTKRLQIIVPLVSVAIIGVCILIVCWRRHRQNDRNHGRHDAESVPLMEIGTITGKLCFYDLWVMVSKATPSDMAKLHDTLREMGITRIAVPEELTYLDAYQHLCQWKSDNADDNQLQILLAALNKLEYTAAWNDICDVRKNSVMISEGTLEHILWQIGDPRKIDKFLLELIPGRTKGNFDVTEKIIEFIEEPLRELREWSEGSLDTNPFVLVSLALESARCSPVDRTFFCVPDQPVSSDEVQRFVKSLTRRHCESLAKIRSLTRDYITLIVEENQNDLFDTESMVIDWLAQGNSSHIDKRCQLNHAVIDIGRHDLKGYFVGYDCSIKLPNTGHAENIKLESAQEDQRFDNCGSDLSDAELHRIVKYLEPAQIAASFKEIDEEEEQDNFDLLKTWVKKEINAGLPVSCRRVLRNKLEPYGKQELIPRERKEDICLVELADITFSLMMMDVYPLAVALKISNDKLKLYKRKSLREYQLSRGTIGILVTFCQRTNYARGQLCDALASVAGVRKMAHLLRYGYQVSHSDLFSVALGEGAGKEQRTRIRENLGIVSETEEAEDTLDVLRNWRSMIKPPTYNLKGALADVVFSVFGEAKALHILSGAVISSGCQSGNVIAFIRDTIICNQASHIADILGVKQSSSESMKVMLVLKVWKDSMKIQGLNDAQQGQLCRRLTDEGFKNFSSKLRHGKLQVNETGEVIKEMENAIKCDVATGLAEILGVKLHTQRTSYVINYVLDEWQEKIRKKPLEQQERIDLSNKLFKEGYLEFSLEIMMGFVPKPMETTQKETTGLL